MARRVARPAALSTCLHCGSALPERAHNGYCCLGCKVVRGLIESRGLERFYSLRQGMASPPTLPTSTRDHKWLEPLAAGLCTAKGPTRVRVDVQGLHCTACVWLQQELFKRHDTDGSALAIEINPALGQCELLVRPNFDLEAWATDVEAFGYLLGPARKSLNTSSSRALTRVGVAIALALNAMLFSVPIYLGLQSGPVYEVFRWLAFALATASTAVGGSVFARSAWRAARRGLLHLDLPIALGIFFSWASSTVQFFSRRDTGTYFDTVATFVALMLLGRWLQGRAIARNRDAILASDGIDDLLARRIEGDRTVLVAARRLRANDKVLVAPGDLVPCASRLDDTAASVSLDWINGESSPRSVTHGDTLSAGAFNASPTAITVTLTEDFSDSVLPSLLRSPPERDDTARATPWWQRLTRVYVTAVLFLSALGFVFWSLTHGLARGAEIATATLVVTCPCAFGLATPLAYELAQSGLRRVGMFIRSASLLDRLTAVRRVVFDKTGTLTTGVLELTDPTLLDALPPQAQRALWNMVVRSTHPRSVALRRAFENGTPPPFINGLTVTESPGDGLTLSLENSLWRLGRGEWASTDNISHPLTLTRDGVTLATFDTEERFRIDARDEVHALTADRYDVWILSGDEPARVSLAAQSLELPSHKASGAMRPEHKASWIEAHDNQDTLMIGDGINDAPAFEKAFCSATPAVDRPFMPTRADAWFTTAGLAPVRRALRVSRALAAINRRNLVIATGYNLITVSLALSGLMSPLLCAAVMPLTSLSLVAATTWSLSPRRPLWKS